MEVYFATCSECGQRTAHTKNGKCLVCLSKYSEHQEIKPEPQKVNNG